MCANILRNFLLGILTIASIFTTNSFVMADDAATLCLTRVSDDIRRHMPRSTNFGFAVVEISFHVSKGGSLSNIHVSSSSPKHSKFVQHIIASSRGPRSCGDYDIGTKMVFN